MNKINIELIVQQVLSGKTKKFENIIDYYKNRLYGYIFKQLRNKEDSEDVLQEVFLKVYRSLDKYDTEQNFTSWIITITRNTIIDHFRKTKPKNELIYDLDIIDMKTPEKVVIADAFSESLDEMINQLPEKYRVLIILKYFEELSYEEISEQLGIQVKKIRWQLHQARKKLMKLADQEVKLWTAK